jgi:trimethylamine:corrinoid methyltransferase-like protein
MPAMLRDAKQLDSQAGFEAGLTGVVSALAADIVDAMQLDTDLLVDYADLVFCNEAMGALRRVQRAIRVDVETTALSLVREEGHRGGYLTRDHTLNHFRTELWSPDLLERRSWESWQGDGGLTLEDVCRARVSELLADGDQQEVLPGEQQTMIDAVVERRTSMRVRS